MSGAIATTAIIAGSIGAAGSLGAAAIGLAPRRVRPRLKQTPPIPQRNFNTKRPKTR
jgi:hypothetical protein